MHFYSSYLPHKSSHEVHKIHKNAVNHTSEQHSNFQFYGYAGEGGGRSNVSGGYSSLYELIVRNALGKKKQ
jgi:hypothetical protein